MFQGLITCQRHHLFEKKTPCNEFFNATQMPARIALACWYLLTNENAWFSRGTVVCFSNPLDNYTVKVCLSAGIISALLPHICQTECCNNGPAKLLRLRVKNPLLKPSNFLCCELRKEQKNEKPIN